ALVEVINLVGDLVERLHGDRSRRVSVKGADWPDDLACRFADLVREHRWMVGMPSRVSRHPGWSDPDARFADFTATLDHHADLMHMEPGEVERFGQSFRSDCVYFDQFYAVVKLSINALADARVFMRRLDVIADNKIGDEYKSWMEFFIYVALTGRYPHYADYFYQRRGPKLVSFRSEGDEDNEGLV